MIDSTRPWLLKIGSYTKITRGVVILTHDYSLDVLRKVYGEWLGEGKTTVIGENCFIGMNSIILMGSHIGNNVIVGAGSVVHGIVPNNVVVAGNPAKVICTLEEHYLSRKRKTIEEAFHCAKRYREVFRKKPEARILAGFGWLWSQRTEECANAYGISFHASGDESAEIEKAFYNSVPMWDGYETFLEEVFGKNEF